ncbi:DUF4174 domain-containing protein [Alphaproteobacteria bacterium GH1-50]|uniref:DUF4174 domain-containing protein n=1 Tax=Kangsaoukella pontilimi TaxID=2691042 RepID=A0A7C9MS26_9RHOB|nr:DUF4174 domain-containing protein [Kangsaoukella pontilimi]MXQ08817.1 DUF4174 domain-containing protein [Kangsaoukella pontilimi]
MFLTNALKRLTLAALVALPFAAGATDGTATDSAADIWGADRARIFDASEVTLDEFKWIARPVIVFADTAADPAFSQQIELLTQRMDELIARDVVIITDTSPDDRSELRRKLRPRGFMLTLIGKDGGVKLRKPFPWDVREISRSIDKMPMRQQEIRDAKRGR